MTHSPTSDRVAASTAGAVVPTTVSVVIPSRARPRSLVRCLEALCAQTLPRDAFEVIVCDDGSPEPLEPSVARFADHIALTVVRQENAGPAAARNTGARHASGQYLAFTDDDCVPAPDWLQRLVARFDVLPGHLIGGAIVNLLPDDPYATATQLIMDCVYEEHGRNTVGDQFFSTSNLAVPAARFWSIDGFSESFPRAAGEDYDFCARWHEAGFPTMYAPEAAVGHAHGHDLRSYWRQHFNYGRSLLRVRQGMAARRQGSGIELEPPSFYWNILTYPLRHGRGAKAWHAAALVVLSQVATAAGAARESVLGVSARTKTSEQAASVGSGAVR